MPPKFLLPSPTFSDLVPSLRVLATSLFRGHPILKPKVLIYSISTFQSSIFFTGYVLVSLCFSYLSYTQLSRNELLCQLLGGIGSNGFHIK